MKLTKTNIASFLTQSNDESNLERSMKIIYDLLDVTGFNSWNLYWNKLYLELLYDQKNTPLIIRKEKGYPIINITPKYFEIKPITENHYKKFDYKNIEKVSISIRTDEKQLFKIRGVF